MVTPELQVTPAVTTAGAVILLRPLGLEDRFLGGPLSFFQQRNEDGRLEAIYRLFAPHGGRMEPWYEELTYPSFIHSVGIRGSVDVVVPPVRRGSYRIEREFEAPRVGPGPHQLKLYGLVTVT
jgi:hypothetical protein